MTEKKKETSEKAAAKKGVAAKSAPKAVEKPVNKTAKPAIEKKARVKNAVVKKEVKTVKNAKKAEGKKPVVKKSEEKPREKRKKNAEEKKIDNVKEAIKKKKLPTFRGRFGKRWKRKRSIKKWNKWRRARGIDIKHNKEDGMMPNSGYGTRKTIRHMHPSGLKEVLVSNTNDLGNVKENNAVRISGTVGRKKRKTIIEEAGKRNLKVLNPGKR